MRLVGMQICHGTRYTRIRGNHAGIGRTLAGANAGASNWAVTNPASTPGTAIATNRVLHGQRGNRSHDPPCLNVPPDNVLGGIFRSSTMGHAVPVVDRTWTTTSALRAGACSRRWLPHAEVPFRCRNRSPRPPRLCSAAAFAEFAHGACGREDPAGEDDALVIAERA